MGTLKLNGRAIPWALSLKPQVPLLNLFWDRCWFYFLRLYFEQVCYSFSLVVVEGGFQSRDGSSMVFCLSFLSLADLCTN